jgi:hypothetical protein
MRRFRPALGILIFMSGVAAADTNHCEIAVSGEATASIKADVSGDVSQGKLSAATDYWMSDAQLRTALGVTENLGSKATPAEKQRKVEEAMKKDPRFMLLVINCLTDDGGLVLSASSPSKYASVPLKPATYPIVSDGSRGGEFIPMFHTGGGAAKRVSYRLTEPGKLTLTQFDHKAIAGTFTFKAESRGKDTKHVTVTGSFHYRCRGGACQK